MDSSHHGGSATVRAFLAPSFTQLGDATHTSASDPKQRALLSRLAISEKENTALSMLCNQNSRKIEQLQTESAKMLDLLQKFQCESPVATTNSLDSLDIDPSAPPHMPSLLALKPFVPYKWKDFAPQLQYPTGVGIQDAVEPTGSWEIASDNLSSRAVNKNLPVVIKHTFQGIVTPLSNLGCIESGTKDCHDTEIALANLDPAAGSLDMTLKPIIDDAAEDLTLVASRFSTLPIPHEPPAVSLEHRQKSPPMGPFWSTFVEEAMKAEDFTTCGSFNMYPAVGQDNTASGPTIDPRTHHGVCPVLNTSYPRRQEQQTNTEQTQISLPFPTRRSATEIQVTVFDALDSVLPFNSVTFNSASAKYRRSQNLMVRLAVVGWLDDIYYHVSGSERRLVTMTRKKVVRGISLWMEQTGASRLVRLEV